MAKSIVDIATGQKSDRDPTLEEQGNDPAVVVTLRKKGEKPAGPQRSGERLPDQRLGTGGRRITLLVAESRY